MRGPGSTVGRDAGQITESQRRIESDRRDYRNFGAETNPRLPHQVRKGRLIGREILLPL